MHKKIIGLFDKTEKRKAVKTKKNKTPPGKKSANKELLVPVGGSGEVEKKAKRDRSAYQFKSMGVGLKTNANAALDDQFHFIDGVEDTSDRNVRLARHGAPSP